MVLTAQRATNWYGLYGISSSNPTKQSQATDHLHSAGLVEVLVQLPCCDSINLQVDCYLGPTSRWMPGFLLTVLHRTPAPPGQRLIAGDANRQSAGRRPRKQATVRICSPSRRFLLQPIQPLLQKTPPPTPVDLHRAKKGTYHKDVIMYALLRVFERRLRALLLLLSVTALVQPDFLPRLPCESERNSAVGDHATLGSSRHSRPRPC